MRRRRASEGNGGAKACFSSRGKRDENRGKCERKERPNGRGNGKKRGRVESTHVHAHIRATPSFEIPAGLGSELRSWRAFNPSSARLGCTCKVTSTCSRVALAANAKLNHPLRRGISILAKIICTLALSILSRASPTSSLSPRNQATFVNVPRPRVISREMGDTGSERKRKVILSMNRNVSRRTLVKITIRCYDEKGTEGE